MGEHENLKDIPKESSNIKSYEKSLKATKSYNKTNKITKIQNNKIVGYPDGIGKKNEMPSHVFHGPEDHTQALETEEQKARANVKPKTGTCSEGLVKPNTGTPSNSPNNTVVSPSLIENEESVPKLSHILPGGSRLDTTLAVPVPSLEEGKEELDTVPGGWKPEQPDLPEGGEESRDIKNYSARLETKLEQLRMRWAGSNYEIIMDKLEMLESWKEDTEDSEGVKEALVDWMMTNE